MRVLAFELVTDRRSAPERYVALRRGAVHIGALQSWSEVDERARSLPTGVELVLEVDDVVAERDRVVAAGWTLAEDLEERSWGLTDFRLHDPAGYYVRVTDRK